MAPFVPSASAPTSPTCHTQVLEFLPYSVGLNPAILSVVEAEMGEAPVVESKTEPDVVETKTRDATD